MRASTKIKTSVYYFLKSLRPSSLLSIFHLPHHCINHHHVLSPQLFKNHGLNAGASLVPYLTTLLWDRTPLGPDALPWMTLASAFAPLPLLAAAAAVAADRGAPAAKVGPEALTLR